MINLRIGIIKNCNNFNSDQITRYNFKIDQIDRLYTNRFEEQRLDVTEAILKEYLSDKDKK